MLLYHLSFSVLLTVFNLEKVNVNGATVQETLVISSGQVSPDNFEQTGLLINDQFPGPPIYVNPNDTLIIQLVNNGTKPFALHLHGILQKGTVASDGVPFVTQDPIAPGESYTYTIQIGNQSGTFMYHAHTGLDLVWTFGALIIRDPEDLLENTVYAYDEERILLISQCWHVPLQSIEDGLVGVPFEDVPDTSSILINGHSYGEWEKQTSNTSEIEASPKQNINSTGYDIITVKQGQTYRFRVVGLGMDSMLAFHIEGHPSFQVIEVDGVLNNPVETDTLHLNSAQRYSILITMNQPVGNYWIVSEMYPGPGPRNGRAILHYEGAPDPLEMINAVYEGESEELELNQWVLDKLVPSTSVIQPVLYPVPDGVDRQFVITSFQKTVPSGQTKFDMNGIIHRNSTVGPTLLHELEAGRDILENKEYGVYEIFVGERVQIIFENRMSDEGECEQHPWHTHGHTFYVVGQGPDSFDPVVDAKAIDDAIANSNSSTGFLFRDVVTLFPSQRIENTTSGAACGWTAVRFIADNPGLWLVHCHLTPHQIMGKHFVLYEHPKDSPLVTTRSKRKEDLTGGSSTADSLESPGWTASLRLLSSFAIGMFT